MSGFNKRSSQETGDHHLIIMQMMIDGHNTQSIITHMMENMGYITEANCRRVISKAYAIIKKDNNNQAEKFKDKYSEMYLQIYKKAIDAKDLKNAIKAIDSLSRLQGLLIQKIEQKTEQKIEQKIDLTNLSDENLEKLVNKIIEKEE